MSPEYLTDSGRHRHFTGPMPTNTKSLNGSGKALHVPESQRNNRHRTYSCNRELIPTSGYDFDIDNERHSPLSVHSRRSLKRSPLKGARSRSVDPGGGGANQSTHIIDPLKRVYLVSKHVDYMLIDICSILLKYFLYYK